MPRLKRILDYKSPRRGTDGKSKSGISRTVFIFKTVVVKTSSDMWQNAKEYKLWTRYKDDPVYGKYLCPILWVDNPDKPRVMVFPRMDKTPGGWANQTWKQLATTYWDDLQKMAHICGDLHFDNVHIPENGGHPVIIDYGSGPTDRYWYDYLCKVRRQEGYKLTGIRPRDEYGRFCRPSKAVNLPASVYITPDEESDPWYEGSDDASYYDASCDCPECQRFSNIW